MAGIGIRWSADPQLPTELLECMSPTIQLGPIKPRLSDLELFELLGFSLARATTFNDKKSFAMSDPKIQCA